MSPVGTRIAWEVTWRLLVTFVCSLFFIIGVLQTTTFCIEKDILKDFLEKTQWFFAIVAGLVYCVYRIVEDVQIAGTLKCPRYPGERNCNHIHVLLRMGKLPAEDSNGNLRQLDVQDDDKKHSFAYVATSENPDLGDDYLNTVAALVRRTSHDIAMTLPRSPYTQIDNPQEHPAFVSAMKKVRGSAARHRQKVIWLGYLADFQDSFARDFVFYGNGKPTECKLTGYLKEHVNVREPGFPGCLKWCVRKRNDVELLWRIRDDADSQKEYLRIAGEMDVIAVKTKPRVIIDKVVVDFRQGEPDSDHAAVDTQTFFETYFEKDAVFWELLASYSLAKQRDRSLNYSTAQQYVAAKHADTAWKADVLRLQELNQDPWKEALSRWRKQW
ncbi:MAG: hypothetical protein A2340_06790 [Lentisphaerae bacterium RIFOXYB12_FULL_60_10]|nr:MAG: hypothetical protein A2340_06790 [Lentisphaerae bacterium RIFOXYB12_FULL_60_10]